MRGRSKAVHERRIKSEDSPKLLRMLANSLSPRRPFPTVSSGNLPRQTVSNFIESALLKFPSRPASVFPSAWAGGIEERPCKNPKLETQLGNPNSLGPHRQNSAGASSTEIWTQHRVLAAVGARRLAFLLALKPCCSGWSFLRR